MKYTCSRCGVQDDEKVTMQGGRRQLHLPAKWSEVTFRTGEQARENHFTFCGPCTILISIRLFHKHENDDVDVRG